MRHITDFRLTMKKLTYLVDSTGVTCIHTQQGNHHLPFLDQLRALGPTVEITTRGKTKATVALQLKNQYGKYDTVLIDQYGDFPEPQILEEAAINIPAAIVIINRRKYKT